MDESSESISSVEGSATPRIAECWADLTRALTLYPETNSRVLQALAEFLDALRAVKHVDHAIEVAFVQQRVWIEDQVFELKAGSNLTWLKERLDRASLSGIVFAQDVGEQILIGFTKRLLELFTRRNLDLRFDELWPAPFRGLSLLERRFEGAFSDRNDEEDSQKPSIAGRTRRREETLSNALTQDETIRKRLRAIQEDVGKTMEIGRRVSRIDLLGSIIDVLPEEALNDFQTARDLSLKVLESVQNRLLDGDVPENVVGLEGDSSFRRLVFLVGRTHFHRMDPGQRADPVRPAQETKEEEKPEPVIAAAKIQDEGQHPVANVVRAGDEKIDDNLDALLAELEELGPLETELLHVEDLEDTAEQLGVYLHYLVTVENPGKYPALKTGLKQLLDAPDDGVVGVLTEYLEPLCATGSTTSQLHLGRAASWLRRHNKRDLLRRCGVLSAQWVTREFPDEFLIYLQTLDLEDARDVAELNAVCTKIGEERFRQAKDLLQGEKEFLDGPLPKRILSLPFKSVAPLARQIFERKRREYRAEFASFLLASVARKLDKAILEILGGSPFLHSDYLISIADENTSKLKEQRQSMLHSFIASTEGDATLTPARVRAVKLLANFNTPRIHVFLHNLVKARRFLVFPVQPRPVRVAAAAVLRTLESKGK